MTTRTAKRPAATSRRASATGVATGAETAPAGRPYGGRTPDDRIAERRRRFLDAGRRVFGDSGYRSATVRALCRAAGLTERYFYESFAGTEDLLVAVYRECVGELEQALLHAAAAQAGKNATILVPAMLDAFFLRIERDPALARVVWLEVLGVSATVDALYGNQVRHFAQLVMGLAEAMQPAPRIPRQERDALAMALVGAVSQSSMDWLLGDFRTPRNIVVSATARVFIALLDSLTPPPARRKKS